MDVVFDHHAFYRDLDEERNKRDCSWGRMCRESGIHIATIANYRQQFIRSDAPAKNMHINTLARLVNWMGVTDISSYIRRVDV